MAVSVLIIIGIVLAALLGLVLIGALISIIVYLIKKDKDKNNNEKSNE